MTLLEGGFCSLAATVPALSANKARAAGVTSFRKGGGDARDAGEASEKKR